MAILISKALIEDALKEHEQEIYRHGGPRPGASREERVAYERQRRREEAEQAPVEYDKRNKQAVSEWLEKNGMFRLIEEVERSLRETPIVNDKRRWDWLCDSLSKPTATPYFDDYPNWRARAWVASATMYGSMDRAADELACLKRALELNPQLPVKRRLMALENLVASSRDSKP